jgi:hypothetical protein
VIDQSQFPSGLAIDSDTNPFPLIALSTDGGSSWSYPIQKTSNLSTGFLNYLNINGSGLFAATSCTGTTSTAICVAAGTYSDINNTNFPLVAVSRNGGSTWSYPVEKAGTLPSGFNDGILSGTSCSGTQNTAICIVTGSYSSK